MNFCRRCGSVLKNKAAGIYTCENKHTLYVNAAPCVGIFFIDESNNVLLSVRGIEPFKGALDSFGGFVDDQERIEDALARELQEELGLTPGDYETPNFLGSEIGFYPFGGESRSILSLFFWSRLKPHANPVAADDVGGLELLPLADIDLSKMDNTDVREAVKKLRKILL